MTDKQKAVIKRVKDKLHLTQHQIDWVYKECNGSPNANNLDIIGFSETELLGKEELVKFYKDILEAFNE